MLTGVIRKGLRKRDITPLSFCSWHMKEQWRKARSSSCGQHTYLRQNARGSPGRHDCAAVRAPVPLQLRYGGDVAFVKVCCATALPGELLACSPQSPATVHRSVLRGDVLSTMPWQACGAPEGTISCRVACKRQVSACTLAHQNRSACIALTACRGGRYPMTATSRWNAHRWHG